MSVYLVAYDLSHGSEMDYHHLYRELENLEGLRTQESLWLVSTLMSVPDLLARLEQLVQSDDRLWISQLKVTSPKSYGYNYAMGGTKSWLSRHYH